MWHKIPEGEVNHEEGSHFSVCVCVCVCVGVGVCVCVGGGVRGGEVLNFQVAPVPSTKGNPESSPSNMRCSWT